MVMKRVDEQIGSRFDARAQRRKGRRGLSLVNHPCALCDPAPLRQKKKPITHPIKPLTGVEGDWVSFGHQIDVNAAQQGGKEKPLDGIDEVVALAQGQVGRQLVG